MGPEYLLTGSALAIYLLLAWVLGSVLGLHGSDLWIFRGAMAVIGVLATVAYIWYRVKSDAGPIFPRRRSRGEQPDAAGGGSDEIDPLTRDAEARLAASKLRGAKLAHLPAIFLVGPPGSSKTTTMIQSGLEPELLAGQIYQDNSIVSTRSANLWFARQTVFVEAGGALLSDPSRWGRLVRRLAPGRLQAAGKKQQAPRAAVVCFDAEEFLKPGAADTLAVSVRTLQARLGEISQLLGISFPVYVLFTKMDRLPFFLDYVRNLTQEEATQVLGVTLPIAAGPGEGVYAEQATQRLTAAFNELYFSLCDKRLDFLGREHAAEKLPGAYEFPREFRKLRTSLVQFLVDLSKPSQLRAAPFLRGFYFSGVRPVVVDEIAPSVAAPAPGQQPQPAPGSATGFFRSGQMRPSQPTPAPAPQVRGTRRVPQWLFLSHFFNDLLLADRNAMGASGSSLKANLRRRVLLGSAAGLCLLLSIAFLVSYIGNSNLEARVLEAARGISSVEVGGQAVASLDSLKRLDTLRQVLVTLTEYEREGPPLRLRWGLYTGSDLYPDVRRTYFNRTFHPLLFGGTQAALLDSLRRLPSNPGPNDPYRPVYDALKAYLITTSEYKRSTRAFLSPVLLGRWAEGRNVDEARLQLAGNQFDFYSEELKTANPFSTEYDSLNVERARRYLKSFNADERIYQALVDAASKKYPSVRMFANEVVFDTREVRGAFTKDGWAFMQAAFKKPDQFFGGEEWVLGPQSFANLDPSQLEQKLRGFYYRDFVKEWREFLKAANVSRYANLPDAARKLGILSGGQSPLLGLFCLVSQHTSVEAAEIKNAFDAAQRVVPPACQNQYVGPSNQNYMGSLLSLQALVAQVANSPAGINDPAAGQTAAEAQKALLITGQMAQAFQIDREANLPGTVRTLMEDPITQVERLLRGMGPQELKAKAQGMCNQFRELMAKYPFNPKATVQASIDDVNRFFRPPDGALWQFHAQSLQNLLQQQGNQFVPKPGGTMTITPAFLGFFNRAAAFSLAAYPSGVQQPRLNYTLRTNLAGTNQSIALTIDGQTFSIAQGQAGSKQFAWPGNPPGTSMTVRFGSEGFNWPRYDGLWAAFEFFADSEERSQPSASIYNLEWILRTGQANRAVTTAAGQPVAVRFDLDMMGAPPIFRKGYFAGFTCVSDVAR
jgi:type VI secretion system protein ImpL